jgi:hypothetical protein
MKNPPKKASAPPPPKAKKNQSIQLGKSSLQAYVMWERRFENNSRQGSQCRSNQSIQLGRSSLQAYASQGRKKRLSDYNRSITKSYQKKGTRRYTIPQLGEQSQQSIPPLQVLSKENEATADFVLETELTKAQLRGEDHIPIPRGMQKTICIGKPLCGLSWWRCYRWECMSCIDGIWGSLQMEA